MGKTYSKKPHTPRTKAELLSERYLNNAVDLVVSACIRTLSTVYSWDIERLDEFMESMSALIGEVSDSRATVQQFVASTKELTGVDCAQLIKKLGR